MINYFKKTYSSLFNTRKNFSNLITSISGKKYLNKSDLSSIEEILIESDIGWKITELILKKLETVKIKDSNWKDVIFDILNELLPNKNLDSLNKVILIVGTNGTGKTTSCAKLAKYFTNNDEKVLLIGADTYRAAANQQIEKWANNLNVDIIYNLETKDPAAISFDGVHSGITKKYDRIIIDTAGRLHTSRNLMEELSKINRVINKLTNEVSIAITLDSNTGQNGIQQIKEFKKFIPINSAILTKMDGTAKGGIIINIIHNLCIPISYIGLGEGMDDLIPFNLEDYLYSLLDINKDEEKE